MIKTKRRLRLLRAVTLRRVTWHKKNEVPFFQVHEAHRGWRDLSPTEDAIMRRMAEVDYFGWANGDELLADRGEVRISQLGRDTLAGWLK